ncbi:MAG: FAD-binding oxidoreductase [Bacteriovoracaceae bacterium]|nr:FAD-binding oxidoreductase [Bacteriovoracaceae bacterium]
MEVSSDFKVTQMTQSCWQKKIEASKIQQVDVAIVGAGICGLSLAYWLKLKSPQIKIALIDSQEVASGASGRNAGFYTAGSTAYLANLAIKSGELKAAAYWDFKQESLKLMKEHLFTQFEAHQEFWGSTTLYRSDRELEEHLMILQRMKVTNLKKISENELGFSGLSGGLKFENEGRVNPIKLLTELKKFLQEKGVLVFEHNAVSWAEERGDKVQLVCARTNIEAGHVFLALNGYAGEFHPDLGKWVAPKRAQMLALDLGGKVLNGNYYDPAHKVYFRQDPTSATPTLLVGGMRLLEEVGENSNFDKTTSVIQQALQSYAEGILGQKMNVLARWSGIMGFTQEEKPYVRTAPFIKHTTFVGGFSGHGMGLAFGTAHEAVARFLSVPTRFKDILPVE